MNLTFDHATHPLAGVVTPPGDKSMSHRAALFAALADGESVIDRFLVSGVTRAMLQALSAFGVQWECDAARLSIRGRGMRGFATPDAPVYCGNSGTTLRLLAGAAAATGTACVLDGSEGLRKRPMNRIVDPLIAMGAPVSLCDSHAPIRLNARDVATPLRAIDYTLPIASAQVKSCLILAALSANATTTLREPGPSRDHTERMLNAMGASILTDTDGVHITPLAHALQPIVCTLPGDISSVAFPMVAAAIVPGSDVTFHAVGINPTRTGLIDALREMGTDIVISNVHTVLGEPVGDIRIRARPLHGIVVRGERVVRMIDEFPAFSIAACFATGETIIHDAEELRFKETDRIALLCRELTALGATPEERRDGYTLRGGHLRGGTVDAHGDHRLAMALSLAGLATPEPVIVENAEILAESFPDFIPTIRGLL